MKKILISTAIFSLVICVNVALARDWTNVNISSNGNNCFTVNYTAKRDLSPLNITLVYSQAAIKGYILEDKVGCLKGNNCQFTSCFDSSRVRENVLFPNYIRNSISSDHGPNLFVYFEKEFVGKINYRP